MLLVSQRFLKFLSEAHSSCSDFTTGTKTRLFFLFPLHQNSYLPWRGKPAAAEVKICLKYNYLKTSAWCYRAFVLLSCWTSTQEKNTLFYWSYLQLLYSGEWGRTVFWNTFCIIPHNKPHTKRIDEWFSMHLKASSEHSLCVKPDERCGLVLWLKIFGPEPHANIYLGTESSLQFLLQSLFV